MPSWTIIVLIVAACFLPGWLTLRQLVAKERPFSGTWLEIVFAGLTLGIIEVGWLAFVLAEFGWFSILRLALMWGGLSLVLAGRAWRRRPSWIVPRSNPSAARRLLPFVPGWVEYAALGLWLAAAVWLFFRPHQFLLGGADAGSYVNMGAEIARQGSILIDDDLLAELDPALYPAFLRPLPGMAVAPYYILPGFYVIGQPRGEITPQFYHLHPVWQAVANGLGGGSAAGIQAELYLPGLWALLGATAVYLLARRLMGWEVALLALAGLSLNALQVWFARYPTTETLTQFLLWAGLWSLGVWLADTRPQPVWSLLAGLALGQVFLVRIDVLFILPVLGLLGLWLWARGRWRQGYNWFFLPFLLLILHSLIHAVTQSSPYFFELFGFGLQLLRANWLIPAGTVVGVAALLVGIGRYRQRLVQVTRYQRPFLLIAAAAVIILAIYGWFIRPYLGEVPLQQDFFSAAPIPLPNRENLVRLGWYLSPVGIWLGVAGIALLIWQVRRETAVMLGVSLLISLIYLTNIRANPHQIYAMRRYVPVTMPIFILGAACFLGWLAARRKTWSYGAAILLSFLWLAGLGWSARGFISQVDYLGMAAQLDRLSAQFAPHSILIFNDPAPIGQGDIIGTPLRFLKGHDVLTLRNPEALDKPQFDQLLWQWQQEGRSVYWIKVLNGYDWSLPGWTFSPAGAYDIQTITLESRFDRRPTQLETWHWQGEIVAIGPLR